MIYTCHFLNDISVIFRHELRFKWCSLNCGLMLFTIVTAHGGSKRPDSLVLKCVWCGEISPQNKLEKQHEVMNPILSCVFVHRNILPIYLIIYYNENEGNPFLEKVHVKSAKIPRSQHLKGNMTLLDMNFCTLYSVFILFQLLIDKEEVNCFCVFRLGKYAIRNYIL